MKALAFHSAAGNRPARRVQRGFTVVELMFGIVVLVITSMVLIGHLATTERRTAANRERVFAYHKAQSLLSELQAYVDRGEAASATDLDALDDGATSNPVLTISTEGGDPVAPDHPLSGNFLRDGLWTWSRRITVRPFVGVNNRNVRYVTVRVFRRDTSGTEREVAQLAGVVNSLGSAYPSSQVFDVFLLALENIPGWWVHMDAIRPFVEAALTDIQSRNPGAVFRARWITKAGYGRNRHYAPYINEALPSTAPIPSVYMYPGRMPAGSASTYYYVPSMFGARMNRDGAFANDYDPVLNPHPYALADRFNHAMRAPEERALFEARVQAGLESPDEPTLRMLLDDMAGNPDKYHNAILVNLHGELLPMPSVRNYSDPAKDPANPARRGLRVVTHPERLRYSWDPAGSATQDVTLRVYAWHVQPDAVPAEGAVMDEPITLQVFGVDLTGNINGQGSGHPTLFVERLPGGVDAGAGVEDYRAFEAAPTSPQTGRDMYFEASFVPGPNAHTLLKLHHTPFRHPPRGPAGNAKGLGPAISDRLYGLEYIPSSVEQQNDFARDLDFAGAGPKNTARWRIRLPAALFAAGRLPNASQVLTVGTRIGENLLGGRWFPPLEPENLSTTYVYWNNDPALIPFSERYQWQGDPRHSPYADLKHNGATFPNGYNWYFTDFRSGGNAQGAWGGYHTPRMANMWMEGYETDLPRFMLWLRTAITRSEAVYTTLTGFSYYYVAFGNEIGYDAANGYPLSIPVDGTPFGTPGVSVFVDSIATGGNVNFRFQKLVRQSAAANYWWGMPWLGELYPDGMEPVFRATGNLPAGSTTGTFHRARMGDITQNLPFGTTFGHPVRRTAAEGCTTVFNIGSSNSTFKHQFADNTMGALEGAGNELANRYGFPLPDAARISRPFRLDAGSAGTVGPEWIYTDTYPRFHASVLRTYYRHQGGGQGSSLVQLYTPGGSRSARVVVSGLDRTIESGSAFIARYSILSLIHSFFESGHPSLSNRILMPPRVTIVSPTEITELEDPASISVQWSVDWTRWDGRPYTESMPSSFQEDESQLVYVLLYSRDNGETFLHMQDGSPATPGRLPQSSVYHLPDAGPGNESWIWNTPSFQFPAGAYVLRVEAYRANQAMHYAYHRARIYIQR